MCLYLGHSSCPTKANGGWGLKGWLLPLQPRPYWTQGILSRWHPGTCPYHMEVHHSSVWDHKHSQQDRHLRTLYVGPCAGWASTRLPMPISVVPTAKYGESHSTSSQVPICLWNLDACPIIIPAKVMVGKVTLTNKMSPVVLLMGTLGKPTCGHQKDWIMEELNLKGLEEWPNEQQEQARQLLVKWEHLFTHSNLDLGKTSPIKQQIELTNWTPFKMHYQWITPICTMTWRPTSKRFCILGPSGNHTVCGLAQWSWSGKGMGAWGSVLTSGKWIVGQ